MVPSSVGGFVELHSYDLFCYSTDVSSDHGEDELPTEGSFEGHQEAVNALQVHNGLLYTCSGDRSVRAFDLVVSVAQRHASSPWSAPFLSKKPPTCLVADSQMRGRVRGPRLQSQLPAGVRSPVPASPPVLRFKRPNHPLLQPEGNDPLSTQPASAEERKVMVGLLSRPQTQKLQQQFSLPDRVLCLHSRWKTLYAGLANGAVVTFNLKVRRSERTLKVPTSAGACSHIGCTLVRVL